MLVCTMLVLCTMFSGLYSEKVRKSCNLFWRWALVLDDLTDNSVSILALFRTSVGLFMA